MQKNVEEKPELQTNSKILISFQKTETKKELNLNEKLKSSVLSPFVFSLVQEAKHI
jgi:hypothetical protein